MQERFTINRRRQNSTQVDNLNLTSTGIFLDILVLTLLLNIFQNHEEKARQIP